MDRQMARWIDWWWGGIWFMISFKQSVKLIKATANVAWTTLCSFQRTKEHASVLACQHATLHRKTLQMPAWKTSRLAMRRWLAHQFPSGLGSRQMRRRAVLGHCRTQGSGQVAGQATTVIKYCFQPAGGTVPPPGYWFLVNCTQRERKTKTICSNNYNGIVMVFEFIPCIKEMFTGINTSQPHCHTCRSLNRDTSGSH